MTESSRRLHCFKLFGLQRTGTNLMRRGLLANFEITSAETEREWKHGSIERSGEDGLAIVACARHPLAWLDAMYRFSMKTLDEYDCRL